MIEDCAITKQQILLVTTQGNVLAPLVSVIRTILRQVPTLAEPQETISAVENGAFDLVIFDMQGKRDGLPLLSNCKQKFALVPAIAMVPYGDVEMVEQVLEHGADDYISQPISLERLKTSLRNALRVRRLLLGATVETARADGHDNMAALMTGNLKTLKEIEDLAIQHAIASCEGCITQAARALGIGRSTLYRKMQERESNIPAQSSFK